MTNDTSTTADPHHHELSPLLVSSPEGEYEYEYEYDVVLDPSESPHGSASFNETVTNLTKTCMGTGCLALPYAARQGGVLLYSVGLLAIGLWNLYASVRLCHSLDLLSAGRCQKMNLPSATHDLGKPSTTRSLLRSLPPPPNGTATLGKVAWYAMGRPGLVLLDTMTFLLLMGIIIAYDDVIRAFIRGTPFTTGSDVFDAILTALVIAPLTLTDVGYLAKTSAAGLSVLALTFIVIAGYGLQGYDHDASTSIRWLPLNGLTGASNWFGCTVFGFGIVPLTFNFKNSMKEPPMYPMAAMFALLLVAVLYIIIGLVLLVLYPDIEGDVLSEIPQHGMLPIVTRLSMVVVIVATAPLIAIVSSWLSRRRNSYFVLTPCQPCAELIEGKIGAGTRHKKIKIIVRFGICFVSAAISVGIPEFVSVLTLVGSFCVAFVSFCVPPFLYVVLQVRRGRSIFSLSPDVFMLIWGLTATFISTAYIFTRLIAK
jgi:amino acid permease